jgi:hypothetical protein
MDDRGSIMQNASRCVLVAMAFALLGVNPAPAGSPAPAPKPFQLPPECKAVPVRSVEHAEIQQGAAPKLVANGTVSTAGWTDAQLRFRTITKFRSRDASAIYAFVACPPESGAEVVTPITAETAWNLSPQLGRVYHLVIEAATNRIVLDLDKH